jgi:hypothetical protein
MLTNGRIVFTHTDGRTFGKDFDSLEFKNGCAITKHGEVEMMYSLLDVREIRILLRGAT